MALDDGRVRAADAAEQRRLQLGLTQKGVGVDDKTWRRLVKHEKWPSEPLTRGRIEAHLNWHLGALQRIADGSSTPAQEALEPQVAEPDPIVPTELRQAQALLDEVEKHVRSDEPAMARIKVDLTIGLMERLRDSFTP